MRFRYLKLGVVCCSFFILTACGGGGGGGGFLSASSATNGGDTNIPAASSAAAVSSAPAKSSAASVEHNQSSLAVSSSVSVSSAAAISSAASSFLIDTGGSQVPGGGVSSAAASVSSAIGASVSSAALSSGISSSVVSSRVSSSSVAPTSSSSSAAAVSSANPVVSSAAAVSSASSIVSSQASSALSSLVSSSLVSSSVSSAVSSSSLVSSVSSLASSSTLSSSVSSSVSSSSSSSSVAPSLISSGVPVVVSSQEGNLAGANAVDGNTGTRWGSAFTDSEWIYLDLGSTSSISRVVLNWEGAYGRSYEIQVSDDATNWSTIYFTTTGDGGIDDITLSGSGRYIRINGLARGTVYGYSLWEFQVYGVRSANASSSAQSASNASAGASSVVSSAANSSSVSSSSVASSSATSSSSSSVALSNDSIFGANVVVFDTSMTKTSIQNQINAIYAIQKDNQFGTPRTAIMFKPGTYDVDIPVGFFTQVLGLGAMPDDVKVTSIHSDAALPNNNSTQNFWRGVENFAVTKTGTVKWGVSQAVPFRRMHLTNSNIMVSDNYGWASGGWMSDSIISGDVSAWAQQQWISRNAQWGSWSGNLWNMVFVGIANNLPGGTWPTSANTFVDTTPAVREKPFVYLNNGNYEVYVPGLRTNSAGVSWGNGQTAGTSLPISQFYIAQAGVDTAATINAALNQGKHLLLTPGVYDLDDAIQVNNADTVVLGIGFPTLHPTNGNAALKIADVDGVKVGLVLVDAGLTNSPVLIQVGAPGSNASHTTNPTELSDIFVRVGGNGVAKATVSMEVNSNDVIIDHTWLWRADHGAGAAWDSNTARNGLIVNGNNVIAYGLFVEHFQEYQVLWNGNGGRTYFYQSEIPYDPPTQPDWTSAPGVNGWASYKVADTVTSHEAWGLGVYAVFLQPNVYIKHAIEVPDTPNVKFHHMVTVNLTTNGGFEHVINETGDPTSPGVATNTPRVTDYPAP